MTLKITWTKSSMAAAVAISIFSLTSFVQADTKGEKTSKQPEFVYPNARRNESIVDDFHGTKVIEEIQFLLPILHIFQRAYHKLRKSTLFATSSGC